VASALQPVGDNLWIADGPIVDFYFFPLNGRAIAAGADHGPAARPVHLVPAGTIPFGQRSCASSSPYARCMTAPCRRTATPGIVDCSCPIFNGPHDLGVDQGKCGLDGGLIWFSAFHSQVERRLRARRKPHARVVTRRKHTQDAMTQASWETEL